MKTLDIQAKEWFDRANGNSYFSAQITIDFGYKSQKTIYIPFEYGYGDHYLDMAFQKLVKLKLIRLKESEKGYNLPYFCRDLRNIKLRYSKQENCLKRDVIAFGSE
jgi:hypothetical protein